MSNIQITKEQAQKLGFKSVVEVSEDIGFTDFNKSNAFQLRNAYLDLENLGALANANPRLVIRKPVNGNFTPSSDAKVWKSWRQVSEEAHYFSRYHIRTTLVGQVSDVHLPRDYYDYQSNNFFKPFVETKVGKRIKEKNDFSYARFRFPKKSSNTIDINITTPSGDQSLRPKFPGIISKEENRKNYYRWHPQTTRVSSGEAVQKYVYKPGNGQVNFQGFSIPYPNTLSIYNSEQFNIPLKIAPKFNTDFDQKQIVDGLIVISTGDAEQKTICYVSPHTFETGHLNTLEDIYTENFKEKRALTPGYNLLATVSNASWYGSSETGYLGCFEFGYTDNLNGTYRQCSIPSENNTHKRFYKAGDEQKQIYFDHTLPTQYGLGRWCIALSGNQNININTGHSAVVYMHEPNSRIDWQKTDPRVLSGPWVVASGHAKAANQTFLNRASVKKPRITAWTTCRKEKVISTKRLQVPSLIINSKYFNSGDVLPEGIKPITYTYTDAIYPKWNTSLTVTGIAPNTGYLYNPTGNQYSGYIIDGRAVSIAQIQQSGIQIPQTTLTGYKYGISQTGHLYQDVPLKDTYFYKFYNQLYGYNNKTIGTGTWDGIIPANTRFSVELISTTLNSEAGISFAENLAVIYSGYGNGDSIDNTLQTGISRVGAHIIYPNPSDKYMISGEVPWYQKRYPYRHAFNQSNQLSYSSYKSGPTVIDAKNIARTHAINNINAKILQLVNKIFPNLTYKNKKWRRMQAFRQKLIWLKSLKFSHISIPETATPGTEITKRLRPYKQ